MVTKKSKYHHHVAHDQGLLKTLILCWLAILLGGLALRKGLELIPGHIASLFPTFSSSHLVSSKLSDPSWKHLEYHGDVELFRRPISLVLDDYSPFFSTKATGLYAHRAVTAVDLPIEALLYVFRDTPNNVSICALYGSTLICACALPVLTLFMTYSSTQMQVDWAKDLKVCLLEIKHVPVYHYFMTNT